MQYPTPQFIEEEGKIIFFLTFKQFFWLIGGVGIVIVLFYTVPFWLFVAASLLTTALVISIAFVKVDNVTLIGLAMNFLGFLTNTKTYTWKRKESLATLPSPEPAQPKIEVAKNSKIANVQESRIKELKKTVETKK